ncbi:aminopeptidase N-like [Ornithodoros turicata]|uniref:aminopeptidase N-like n=1 Tax=Ornithodoros turicata TaxID=34597 RepID=UPI0031386693
MYESSAEYVMARPKTPRHFQLPDLGKLVSHAWNRRRWMFLGICAALTVIAVAVPAGIRYSMQGDDHDQSPSLLRTITEGEVTEARKPPKAKVAHVPRKPKQKSHADGPASPAGKIVANKRLPTSGKVRKVDRSVHQVKQQLQNDSVPDENKKVSPSTEAHTETPGEEEKEHVSKSAKVAAQNDPAATVYRFSVPSNTTTVPEHFPENSDHHVKVLRLPRSVYPEEYKLRFEPFFFEQSMMFGGRVRISLECRERTKVIQLHASNMAIERENVTVVTFADSKPIDVTSVNTNEFAQFLYINLGSDLLPGEKYYLTIPFKSVALYDNGFNVRRYDRENGTSAWMIGTNFLPTEARRAFPCFDEPGLKATYYTEVVRDRRLHSLSNMALSKVYPKPQDKQADTFLPTFPMSTFSMGFFISDFVSHGNSSFRVWSRPDAQKNVTFVLAQVPRILSFYEKHFSIPYQLSKLDVIAMEHYINDVQNMGMMFLPESVAFFDAEDSPLVKRQSVLQMLCHGIGHQWFGNLITPDWWDDVWLMDGISSYFQYRCLEHLEGYHKIYEFMVLNEIVPVMKHDSYKYSPAVITPVDTQYKIYQSFNIFSTQKAVAIMRMLSMAVGESVLQASLHKIMAERMFRGITTEQLLRAFTETMPKNRPLDATSTLMPWLTQSGFPVLSVTRVYDENAATLVQTKFSLDPEERSSNQLWPIPITFVTSDDLHFNKTTPLFWLKDKEGQLENLPDPHHWVMVNNQFLGYFKVNYDQKNWELIVRQLLWNHSYIHLLNRAQVHNDLFDLAKAGMVNYTIALDSTKYLSKEQEYIPWKIAFDKMKEVGAKMRNTDSYQRWTGYVSSLLKANYGNVTWDNTSSAYSSEFESELVLSACHFGYEPCVEKAVELFNRFKKSPDTEDEIPPHLKYPVFCEAIRTGGEDNWKFLWNRLQTTDDKSERSDIIRSLGCSKNTDTLGSYLKSAVTAKSGLSREDMPMVLDTFADSPEGKGVAFKLLRSQWGSLHKTYRQWPDVLFQVEESLIESANEPHDVEELSSFFLRNKKSTVIPEWRYQQVQEEKKLDQMWQTKFYPVVKNWLKTARPL